MPGKDVIAKIREFTGHDYIKLMPSGNAAIMAAVYMAKKANKKAFFLIPDQGGWLAYKDYPGILGIEVQEIKTNKGLVDLEDLRKQASGGTAFIYQNPAGYFAEQPAKHIYDVCKKAGCPVIMDISGCFGLDWCNSEYADMLVCSFGKWKLVNNEYGGFISARDKGVFDEGKIFYRMMKIHPSANKEILDKIEGLKKRIDFLLEKREKVLKDLQGMEIIHRDKKGINVVAAYKNQKEKDKIIAYCEKNTLEYTECPRYIRVNEQAISIEIKRLSPD